MEQSAVEWLEQQYQKQITFLHREDFEQAKDMERQQLIDFGNSCALKQHIHIHKINKMTESEIRQFVEEEHLTFGEEYYNETFKK
jgi:hypothetical protein